MTRHELHQEVAIGSIQRGAAARRQIDRAAVDPDVVKNQAQLGRGNLTPNAALYRREDQLRLLQARARRRAHVELKGAGVGDRKEILAEERDQDHGYQRESGDRTEHDPAVRERPSEQITIARAEPLETSVEQRAHALDRTGGRGAVRREAMRLAGEQIVSQRRHHRPRQEV